MQVEVSNVWHDRDMDDSCVQRLELRLRSANHSFSRIDLAILWQRGGWYTRRPVRD